MTRLSCRCFIVSSVPGSISRAHLVTMLIVFAASIFAVQTGFAKAPDPLFETHELLELTLEGPLKTISRKRELDVKYPAVLTYRNDQDSVVRLEIELESRGKYRRRRSTCKFTPLKVVFKKKRSRGTVFEGQKKLKLVTQCDPSNRKYEEYLMLEYLAYRIFNEITPQSFAVRLVRINYQEVDSKAKPRSNLAFFIENKKRLAKRLDAKHLEIEQTSAVDIDSRHLNQGSLFQLLIANVDWSATSTKQDECCHNYKLFRLADERLLSIPYDFDLAGIVNAKYAKPATEMGLKSVRDRRYRGYCRNNEFLAENTELFNSRKETILTLFHEFPHLSNRKKKGAISFINSFYKIINNNTRARKVILERCHKSFMREVPDPL